MNRVIPEMITPINDDLGIGPMNPPPGGPGWNPRPRVPPAGAAPANAWLDNVTLPPAWPIPGAAPPIQGININRFIGPGVPGLPRSQQNRQEFCWIGWTGPAVFSDIFATGFHRRTLAAAGGGAFTVTTQQVFGGVALTPPTVDAYIGLPLITFTGINLLPTAGAAVNLAADTTSTGGLGATAQTPAGAAYPAPARSVRWTVLSGDVIITGGNPAVLPARTAVRAGSRSGTFQVRAEDTVHPNRRAQGNITVQPVTLTGIVAAPASPIPAATVSTVVSVTGLPNGRQVTWSLDNVSTARAFRLIPPISGPMAAAVPLTTTVSRPLAGGAGTVTVTAVDSLTNARQRIVIVFL
jgi:hypothetical protein